jgi:protein gp37
VAGESSIEWTDATWNPTRGCSCVSPGCKHCYAMKVAARFSGPGLAYEGLAFMHPKAGGQWTGQLRLVEDALDAPLRWTKPRRIFVNSMSDLFHEALSIEQIAEVFAVMYLAPRHTFQVLTKRAARMREVLTDPRFYPLVLQAAGRHRHVWPKLTGIGISDPTKFPAPWVHLGVSIESPDYLDRGRDLKATPAAVRFISAEPLLADLRGLRQLLLENGLPADCECGHGHGFTRCPNYGRVSKTCHERGCACPGFARRRGEGIHWVIVGGESGAGARRLDVAWVRRIVTECADAGTACFVKQLGANIRTRNDDTLIGDYDDDPPGWFLDPQWQIEENLHGFREDHQGAEVRIHLRSRKGGDMAEWPADLRVRQFPEVRRG